MEELLRQLTALRALAHAPDYPERAAEIAAAVDAAADLAQRLRDALLYYQDYAARRLVEQRLAGMQPAGILEPGPQSQTEIN